MRRKLQANALIRFEARRRSIDEQINRSLMLLERSRQEIARVDRLVLLSRGRVRRPPVLELDAS
jgi:hypothetical protein